MADHRVQVSQVAVISDYLDRVIERLFHPVLYFVLLCFLNVCLLSFLGFLMISAI